MNRARYVMNLITVTFVIIISLGWLVLLILGLFHSPLLAGLIWWRVGLSWTFNVSMVSAVILGILNHASKRK